jgi:hypothetical protein
MSPLRLPLYQPVSLGADAYHEAPRALPGRAIAVLDPGDGRLSLAFAACMVRELAQRGLSVPVALASFEGAPRVPASQTAQFAEGQALYALSVQENAPAIAERLVLPPQGLWLLVGQAALAFAPALTILVGADLPVLRWPDALRAARERISLTLSGDGLTVAVALARALG